jgi:hypothetical protein
MLVILSGAETIHKKFFARHILSKLIPRFDLSDGYSMDFKVHPYQVYDPAGEVVYRSGSDTEPGVNTLLIHEDKEGIKNDHGHQILDEAEKYYTDILLTGVRDNHFQNFFTDIENDFGIRSEPGYEWEEKPKQLLHPHTYDDVLNNYRNSKFPIHVITGSFGKTFIDEIKKDIGAENVQVFNIIRNPTVVALLHERTPEVYAVKAPLNAQIDEKKLVQSTVNCVNLKRFDEVTTIKFEDILAGETITIDGTDITLPREHTPYNDWITEFEVDHLNLGLIGDDRLALWHEFCDDAGIAGQSDKLPKDIFGALGYSKMTRAEVMAPKA